MLVTSVTREEFFKIFPPESRNIVFNGKVIANLGEEVICDLCNADVLTEENTNVHLVLELNSKGQSYVNSVICKECWDKINEKGLNKS